MIGGLLLALLPLQAEARPTEAAPRENVLIVIADDLGVDRVRAYGYKRPDGKPLAPLTPNIDRIAAEGVMFRNAWAHPACSQARAAALTGRYPNRTGIGRFIKKTEIDTVGLSDEERCLPDVLPSEYRSAILGKWHLVGPQRKAGPTTGDDHPVRCGFERFIGTEGNLDGSGEPYLSWELIQARRGVPEATRVQELNGVYATTRTTNDALEVIEEFGEDPWVVWVAYHAPHSPWHRPPPDLVTTEGYDLSTTLGQGLAMIEALDAEIGRLLAGVEPEVLARTTVIFFGDNGTQKRLVEPPFDPERAKATVYQGGVNVPFLVSGARVAEEARGDECHALLDLCDLLPTVAELVGGDVPDGLDGVSFLPALAAPQSVKGRPWIYAERFRPNFAPEDGKTFGAQRVIAHDQTARSERLKLVRRRAFGRGGVTSEVLELYDVEADFFERRDLLDAEGLPPVERKAEFDALLAVLDEMAR